MKQTKTQILKAIKKWMKVSETDELIQSFEETLERLSVETLTKLYGEEITSYLEEEDNKPYWHDAHEYLRWKIEQLTEEGKFTEVIYLCSRLLTKLSADDIQRALHTQMQDDGYFDEPEGE